MNLILFILGFVLQEALQILVRKNDEPFSWSYYTAKLTNIIHLGVNLVVAIGLMVLLAPVMGKGLAFIIGFASGAISKLLIKFFQHLFTTQDGTP